MKYDLDTLEEMMFLLGQVTKSIKCAETSLTLNGVDYEWRMKYSGNKRLENYSKEDFAQLEKDLRDNGKIVVTLDSEWFDHKFTLYHDENNVYSSSSPISRSTIA